MTAGNLQIIAERDSAETGDTIGQGLADPALVASAVCASGDHAGDVDVPAGVRGVVVKAERRRRRFPCRRSCRRRERPADRVLRRPARYWRRRRRTTPSSPRRRRPPPRRGRSSVGGPRDPGASDRACARGGRRPARGGSDHEVRAGLRGLDDVSLTVERAANRERRDRFGPPPSGSRRRRTRSRSCLRYVARRTPGAGCSRRTADPPCGERSTERTVTRAGSSSHVSIPVCYVDDGPTSIRRCGDREDEREKGGRTETNERE